MHLDTLSFSPQDTQTEGEFTHHTPSCTQYLILIRYSLVITDTIYQYHILLLVNGETREAAGGSRERDGETREQDGGMRQQERSGRWPERQHGEGDGEMRKTAQWGETAQRDGKEHGKRGRQQEAAREAA